MNQEHKMIIPKDKIIEIYNKEYLNGVSMVKLSEKYNTYPAYFSMWFKKLNLKARTNKENSRKYHHNENYFETIDTENKAYWLGFIYADGYIVNNRIYNSGGFGVSISEKDRSHLDKLNRDLDSNYRICDYEVKGGYKIGAKYCRLLVSGSKIKEDLIKQGVLPNKTNILKPPILNPELIKHFIRGYLDGDGSIWVALKNDTDRVDCYNVEFIGTDEMLNFINEYLISKGLLSKNYKHSKRREYQIVSSFKFGGNMLAYKVLSHLYENSNIYLDRKYELYLSLKELINSRSL